MGDDLSPKKTSPPAPANSGSFAQVEKHDGVLALVTLVTRVEVVIDLVDQFLHGLHGRAMMFSVRDRAILGQRTRALRIACKLTCMRGTPGVGVTSNTTAMLVRWLQQPREDDLVLSSQLNSVVPEKEEAQRIEFEKFWIQTHL